MNARIPAFDHTDNCPHQAAIDSSMRITFAAQNAIHAIPIGLFDERALCNLLTTMISRLHDSGWRHQEHAQDASDRLLDVFQLLENAAEAKELQ